MLEHCVECPPRKAEGYRSSGLWEGLTIAEMVDRTAERTPDKLALIQGSGRFTYGEMVERSRRLAIGFLDLGVRPQDRVVLQLPNIPEFVFVYLALTRIGAIPVMALRVHRHTEIRHFINASGAVAYVIPDRIKDFDYREMAAAMVASFPELRHVVVAGEPGADQTALDSLMPRPADTDAGRLAVARPDAAEVGTMLLSGGTTSLSKLIPRTHDDYVLNARLCGKIAGFDEHTVFMAILPLAHNYNLASPGILGTFYYGGTVVLAEGTDMTAIFSTVEREGVTVIASVVPLISAWLASDEPDRHDTSSLRVIQNGGARLSPELRDRLRKRFGCIPQEIYGTAEGLINMTRLDDPDDLLLRSSGAPVCEEDEIAVVDDDGKLLPDGEPGELITRGPYTIHGYYNAPDRNAEAFTADGFYRMGDIVRKRGRYVYTEGRRKDLINRGGEKISCEEVEDLILTHDKVKSVSLVGMPDPVFGEKACAFVIPMEGETLSFDELITHLRGKGIASFKLPERLELVDAFPLSPVGKILKRELRERIAASLGNEADPESPTDGEAGS